MKTLAISALALALSSCGNPLTLTIHPDGSTTVTIIPTVTPSK